jgi:hypothetical protein
MDQTYSETIANFKKGWREFARQTSAASASMNDATLTSQQLIVSSRELLAVVENVLARERRMWNCN